MAESAKSSPVSEFLAAVQFLTVTPPLIRRNFSAREMGRSSGYYALVGLLLGAVLVGGDFLLAKIFPLQVRSALILALWTGLSGGLHLDGFLDACDGLLGGFTPESRLEIMRDERVGAFGLSGGVLLFLIKFSALAALPERTAGLLLAPTLGRWGMTLALAAFPYGRAKGLGRDIKDNAGWPQAILGTIVALATAWLAAGLSGILALVLAGLALWSGAAFTLRRIPGMTGDIYGALNEVIEVVVLLALVAAPR